MSLLGTEVAIFHCFEGDSNVVTYYYGHVPFQPFAQVRITHHINMVPPPVHLSGTVGNNGAMTTTMSSIVYQLVSLINQFGGFLFNVIIHEPWPSIMKVRWSGSYIDLYEKQSIQECEGLYFLVLGNVALIYRECMSFNNQHQQWYQKT